MATKVVTKKSVAKAAKPEPKKAKPEKETVVSYVRGLLEDDGRASTQDLIKQVKKKFPDSAFSKAHVAYYRNKFRKEGMDIPLLREVEGEEAPPKAKVKAKDKTKK